MADLRKRQRSPAPLRGRDRECLILNGLLSQVRDGHGGVLLLRGEPGIGKTALLRHLIQSASDVTLLQCASVESELELPYAGLYELCGPLLSGLGALPEPQQRAVNTALGRTIGAPPDRFLVALGVLGLLGAACGPGPVLCLVEDAHWLDQASAQVLGFVGRRLLGEPIGLVFAARAAVGWPDPLTGLPQLHVQGLDERSAGDLLDSVSGIRMDGGIRARIVAETRGNPAGLLELGTHMSTAAFAGGYAPIHGDETTECTDHDYLTRLSAVPRDTQQFVLLAAADPVCDTALIQRAATTMQLAADAADVAIEADLLTIGSAVRFPHSSLRSAVYRGAGIERRRAVHAALAAVTDAASGAARRAWHRAQAIGAPDERVATELIASADLARGRLGVAAAAAFWERAVALTPDLATRSTRALVAARAKFAAGDLEATQRLLARAEAGPSTELEQARAELLRAQVSFTRCRGGEAPAMLSHAAARLAGLHLGLARLANLQALMAAGYAGRLGDAGSRLAIACAALALPVGPAPIPPVQLLLRGVATWQVDGPAAAAPMLKDALRQYRSTCPDPGVVGLAFIAAAMHLCDDDAWYAMLDGHVRLAREHGVMSSLSLALDVSAEFHVYAGEPAKAEALAAEADRIEPTHTAPTSPRIALILAAWRGDQPGARRALPVLAEAAITRAEGWLLAYADHAMAVLHNGLADYARAADAAESATVDDGFAFAVSGRALFELVEAAARSDRLERAAQAAEQLSVFAAASGSDFACGLAIRSRALLADGDAADALHREAIARLGRTRMVTYLGRAHLSYGEWLRRTNRRVDARTQLRLAQDTLAAVGACGFAARARRELQATGEKVRRRTNSDIAALTPQEDQIAQLARDRLTNTEIGVQLFLSVRTVEWHLRKIFAKLEITSRRELDSALTQRATAV